MSGEIVKKASLRLLHRPPMKDLLLKDGIFRRSSLDDDLEEAGDGSTPLSDALVLNILVKFFYAYIYPDSVQKELSLEDVTLLFDQFAHRRLGSEVLDEKVELRKILLSYGFALCMLGDIPRTAHIFSAIAGGRTEPGDVFRGLDIGSGTGILMLAMFVRAGRNGFKNISLAGIERNRAVCERTNEVLAGLAAGRVIVTDAKRPEAYGMLGGHKLDFVANETLPSMNKSLWKEDFVFICKTMFETIPGQLSETGFFPEGVVVGRSPQEEMHILSRENKFSYAGEYPLRLMKPYALIMDGVPVALDAVGIEQRQYIPDSWLSVLGRRW
ncbi:hypothetical protein [Maridesulfovibrio bastinii]|uniref:hypothetical protein n=1 Tax=Maridesulfovibrio bastinii TaxID=47157 RepID=UPI000400A37A|nr:hypothetical protein [Maridesulfovibrio bastinii]